jgi:two-component system, OmpR family, response regulator
LLWAGAMQRILIVEDDAVVANQVKRQLAQSGFETDLSHDGDAALVLGQQKQYCAILLDLGLPKLDGLSILRTWRNEGIMTPVIVLTARGSWMERVEGINVGADDYMPKPFQFEELLARIGAVIRRAHNASADLERIGGMLIDRQRRTVMRDGVTTSLTPLEFQLLRVFADSAGQVIKTIDLIENVYGAPRDNDSVAFDRLLARLRNKIGANVIESHRGVGYRLTVAP